MTREGSTVIVGAGPAGVRAAQTLVCHGVRPVVIDEAPRWGGQIYRQQPPGFRRSAEQLYGFEASRARGVHDAFAALLHEIDYRPGHLVWNANEGVLDLCETATGHHASVPWREVILATGATDRILPVPGWTTPGVYSLGGTQIALKYQGCAIGSQVVLAGSGPLLYLVAYQYKKAGADVRAVLDYASLPEQVRAMPAMAKLPAVLAKGVYYVAWLRLHGVPIHSNARLVRVEGEAGVTAVHWASRSNPDAQHRIACDALGFGYGLRPETQLADLLGCRFTFDEQQRGYLIAQQGGQASTPGVFLAGDGVRIMGADAAELAGERAALALLAQRGVAIDTARVRDIDARLARIGAFREGIERAFPYPRDWAGQVPDETMICRCEAVTAGEIRRTARETGADELNRLKALCRVGMGRCQGRMCGVAAGELLAHACEKPVELVGRIRGQAPVKPVPLPAMLDERVNDEEPSHG